MPAPAACLDEGADLDLVGALRARGYDVTSLHLVGPPEADAYARARGAWQLLDGRVVAPDQP